jgi:hypothetical protein
MHRAINYFYICKNTQDETAIIQSIIKQRT